MRLWFKIKIKMVTKCLVLVRKSHLEDKLSHIRVQSSRDTTVCSKQVALRHITSDLPHVFISCFVEKHMSEFCLKTNSPLAVQYISMSKLPEYSFAHPNRKGRMAVEGEEPYLPL